MKLLHTLTLVGLVISAWAMLVVVTPYTALGASATDTEFQTLDLKPIVNMD